MLFEAGSTFVAFPRPTAANPTTISDATNSSVLIAQDMRSKPKAVQPCLSQVLHPAAEALRSDAFLVEEAVPRP